MEKIILLLKKELNKHYFYLILHIKNKTLDTDTSITNYCFKYKNGNDGKVFDEYNMKNNDWGVNSSISNITTVFAEFQ